MTLQELEAAWEAAGRPGWFTRWVSATYGDDGMAILAAITHAEVVRTDAEHQKRWYLDEYDGLSLYYIQDWPSAIVQPQPGDRLVIGERQYSVEEGKHLRLRDHPIAIAYQLAHEKGLC